MPPPGSPRSVLHVYCKVCMKQSKTAWRTPLQRTAVPAKLIILNFWKRQKRVSYINPTILHPLPSDTDSLSSCHLLIRNPYDLQQDLKRQSSPRLHFEPCLAAHAPSDAALQVNHLI
jgi:hypothetical protein